MTKDNSIRTQNNGRNVVLIGSKPNLSYVMACLTQFNRNEEIIIKARGKSICTAVDVAEILRNRFMKDAKITNISTGTERMTATKSLTMKDKQLNVSTIEIKIRK